ncbi:MAG: TolC family protein [Bacteroidota bacterium]|nr:TolC family protein [Bacteroidota bacterium]
MNVSIRRVFRCDAAIMLRAGVLRGGVLRAGVLRGGVIALLLAGMPKPACAQAVDAAMLGERDTVWQERDVIAAALHANPGLAASRARVDVMQARAVKAGAWPAPTVSFEFYNTPITSLDPLRDGLENDYAIQQMIPLSGMPGLVRDMAAAQARMEYSSVHVRERDLVRDLRTDIAMLMAARGQRRINAENHALLEQILRSVEAAYAVGRASQADVMRLRVEIERSISERLALEDDVTRAEAMINGRLNRPANASVPAVTQEELSALRIPDVHAPANAAANAAANADVGRSELRMMEAEADMARVQATLAGRAWVPELMLRGMYKEMTMGMPDSWALMIGLSIPFAPWAQPAVRGAREEAEALRREVDLRTQDMRRMIEMQRREARSRAAALRARHARYATDLLPASSQAVTAGLEAFGSGTGNFTSLLDAARMHTMLRMEEVMLEAEFRSAHAALRWAEGEDHEEMKK